MRQPTFVGPAPQLPPAASATVQMRVQRDPGTPLQPVPQGRAITMTQAARAQVAPLVAQQNHQLRGPPPLPPQNYTQYLQAGAASVAPPFGDMSRPRVPYPNIPFTPGRVPPQPSLSPPQRTTDRLNGLGDLLTDLQGAFDPASLVASIQLDTTYLPQLVAVDPLKPAKGPTTSSWLLDILKPKFTVHLNPVFGKQIAPIVVAPYGDPGTSGWDFISVVGAIAVAGTVGLAAYGTYSLLFKE
jgi:hypothetical protein